LPTTHIAKLANEVCSWDISYLSAKEDHPSLWLGETRNWNPVASVAINPARTDREEKQAA